MSRPWLAEPTGALWSEVLQGHDDKSPPAPPTGRQLLVSDPRCVSAVCPAWIDDLL